MADLLPQPLGSLRLFTRLKNQGKVSKPFHFDFISQKEAFYVLRSDLSKTYNLMTYCDTSLQKKRKLLTVFL
jgi:hypothetical protein